MKSCLFSVSYAGLWGQQSLSLDAFIAKAAALGYEQVMLMGKRPHLSPLEATPERMAHLKRVLSAAGVECPAMGAYTDFGGFAAAEVPSAEMQILYIEQIARAAARLCERPVVRVFTSYETQPMRLAWDRTADCIRECCDRAAAFGAVLAVQNHHDVGVHTDALLEFLATVDRPNCKLGFDAWSPAARGEDLYEAAKKAAPHAVLANNADYVKLPSFRYDPDRIDYRPTGAFLRAVPFGEGFIDYPAYWQGLEDGGFNGIRAYEMCSPLRGGGSEENLDTCARAYVSWMARWNSRKESK